MSVPARAQEHRLPSPTAADAVGALCAHARVRREGAPRGPLRGLTFAVKDCFAVEGVTACFGNPTWLATHAPAAATAPAVTALLGAGATLDGLTLTDELALSLTGENAHFGTPLNVRAPDRVPGGSSAGSAAAVAAGLVDFALGTDTGGSVRVPASHCGVHGFRPTHGAVSAEGVWPLAPRFDTVGWFAVDGATLARVGDALLPPAALASPTRLLSCDGIETLLDPEARPVFTAAAAALARRLGLPLVRVTLDGGPPTSTWLGTYLALQNAEAVALHGAWIASERPTFGTLIAGRFARALAADPAERAPAEAARAALTGWVSAAFEGGAAWLVWPSAAGAAPPRGLPDDEVDRRTGPALALGALASLCGLPQLSLPLAEVDGCPFGISLVGPPGADRALLAVAAAISPNVVHGPNVVQGEESPS